jgi:hypothetical protein
VEYFVFVHENKTMKLFEIILRTRREMRGKDGVCESN